MHKYNILIVEDEFINARFMKKAVLKLGHNIVDTVKTGDEALKITEEQTIHIVFMDINLEGKMDGIACAGLMNKTKNIPIIYTTAFSDTQTIDEATDTNLFGYLIKPYDFYDIEAVLKLTIKKNYLQKETSLNTNAPLFTQLNKEYKYYAKTKTLIKNEIPIKLTQKEADIFYYLFINLNQTVTKEYLNEYVWDNKLLALSSLRDTILRLRKKIPELTIRNISGVGYSLDNSF